MFCTNEALTKLINELCENGICRLMVTFALNLRDVVFLSGTSSATPLTQPGRNKSIQE